MQAVGPVKVSNRHNSIIDYMIANPTVKLKAVAMTFGMSQPWLSVLIHSSSFKAKLAARQDVVFNEEVCATVEERLLGVASIATDRLLELVPRETDVKVINDTMDKALKNLGYGQRTNGTALQQNNTLVIGGAVDARTINRARNLVGAAKAEPLEGEIAEVIPPKEVALDEPRSVGGTDLPQIPARGNGSLVSFDSITAFFPEGTFEDSSIQEGVEVRGGGPLAASEAV